MGDTSGLIVGVVLYNEGFITNLLADITSNEDDYNGTGTTPAVTTFWS